MTLCVSDRESPPPSLCQCVEEGVPFLAATPTLLAHGLLHLLGYDHVRGGKQAAAMAAAEAAAMAAFGARAGGRWAEWLAAPPTSPVGDGDGGGGEGGAAPAEG